MGLRVEEYLSVVYTIAGAFLEVGPRQSLKIGGFDQDGHANVIILEEVIE
jgi:hypothetical protein